MNLNQFSDHVIAYIYIYILYLCIIFEYIIYILLFWIYLIAYIKLLYTIHSLYYTHTLFQQYIVIIIDVYILTLIPLIIIGVHYICVIFLFI